VLVVKMWLPGVHCIQHADEHCSDGEWYQQHTCTSETHAQGGSVVAVNHAVEQMLWHTHAGKMPDQVLRSFEVHAVCSRPSWTSQ
jgi:hypothetical protein